MIPDALVTQLALAYCCAHELSAKGGSPASVQAGVYFSRRYTPPGKMTRMSFAPAGAKLCEAFSIC